MQELEKMLLLPTQRYDLPYSQKQQEIKFYLFITGSPLFSSDTSICRVCKKQTDPQKDFTYDQASQSYWRTQQSQMELWYDKCDNVFLSSLSSRIGTKKIVKYEK